MKQFVVYILASSKNGTLYIGVTSNLIQRIWQHKNKILKGFTAKYGVGLLVYYELHETSETAIHREKRLKKYTREQKLKQIEKDNPEWKDLYKNIL